MKIRSAFSIGLVVWLSLIPLAAAPVWAQDEPVTINSIRPSSARPGEEVSVTIEGRGFGGQRAEVSIDGLHVTGVTVESDRAIRARVGVPEGAEHGPRTVVVVIDKGGPQETFGAELPGGFTVAGGDEPTPIDGPDVDPWTVIILGVVAVILLISAVAAVAIAKRIRQSRLKRRWQSQAEDTTEAEMPESCQPGSVHVRRDPPQIKPSRWKLTGIQITLYDAARSQRGGTTDAPEELVKRIDRTARNQLIAEDRQQLARSIAEFGPALAAAIITAQSRSQSGQDVYLVPQIEGGEASVEFTLYRCVGQPGGWKKVTSWEAKVQAAKHMPRTFHGPAAGEPPDAYRTQLETQLKAYLQHLIGEVKRLI